MPLIGSLITFNPNTPIISAQANQNNADIKTAHNLTIDPVAGHTHDGTAGNGPKLTLSALTLPELPPIGSIIPFYDFNGGLTFDGTKWAYCNGQAVAVGSLGSQTLPDLSGRYLVGFGTDGAGDLGSAAWATAAVGNASHQINLQHSHTVDAHSHNPGTYSISTSVANTTLSSANLPAIGNTSVSHTHTLSNAWAGLYVISAGNIPGTGGDNAVGDFVATASNWNSNLSFTVSSQSVNSVSNSIGLNLYGASDADLITHNHNYQGTADHNHTATSSISGTSANTSPGTNNALSTTQSIQPRSVRVRYIMRIA